MTIAAASQQLGPQSQILYEHPLSGLGLHLKAAEPARFPVARGGASLQTCREDDAARSSRALPRQISKLEHLSQPCGYTRTQLPTPPMSTSTHWTPRLPSLIGLPGAFSPALDGHAQQISSSRQGSRATSGHTYAHAQNWQNRPNSIAPAHDQHDYSLGSDISLPAGHLDSYDGLTPERTPDRTPVFARAQSGESRERKDTPAKLQKHAGHVMTARKSRTESALPRNVARGLHRRLPVLEEDSSFRSVSTSSKIRTLTSIHKLPSLTVMKPSRAWMMPRGNTRNVPSVQSALASGHGNFVKAHKVKSKKRAADQVCLRVPPLRNGGGSRRGAHDLTMSVAGRIGRTRFQRVMATI